MMGYVTALVPSIGVLALFWVAIRAMVQADRRERMAQARIELAERTAAASATSAAEGRDDSAPSGDMP